MFHFQSVSYIGAFYCAGKRSVERRQEDNEQMQSVASNDHMITSDPIAFDWTEHGDRLKRHLYKRETCNSDTQYILFLLDTSGSIPESDFHAMTSKLGKLIPHFCKPIKVAVMTFDHNYYLEFCFNCFENSCLGRAYTCDAMNNIQYRGGATYTGGAIRCVNDVLLSAGCGLTSTQSCIDLIVITDGRSNDPSRDVCQEVNALQWRFGERLTTHAIGIGNVRHEELQCIRQTASLAYYYNNHQIFLDAIDSLVDRLRSDPPYSNGQGQDYICANSNLNEDVVNCSG